MAGRKQSILLSVAAMAVVLVGVCSAATYTVGDTTGWNIPPSSSASTFYSNWASQHTFQAGDVLVFNFTTGHTVAPVSKASYDSCNSNNPLSAAVTASPARITLTAGTHYYLCTTQGHCTLGQKLAVIVTGPSSSSVPSPQPTTATPAPPPTPRPTATASPPPTPSPPTPTAGATPPTAGGPSVPTTPDTGTPPPAGNFAAPTAAGVSLLSLVSVAAAAAFLF